MLSFIGIFFFLFFFLGMLRAQAYRWRLLAKNYARQTDRPIQQKSWQSGILISASGYNSLKGILNIGVHENGVSISVFQIFSLFHKPLFIPYEDILAWQTTWYLDAESVELEFRQTPGVKFVMPKEQAEWVQSFAGNKLALENISASKSVATRGWHAFAMVHAGVMLGCVAVLLFLVMR